MCYYDVGGGKMTAAIMEQLLKRASNPEESQAALLELKDNIEADSKQMEALKVKVDEMTGTINTLRDTNQRLFLRVGFEPEKTDEPEGEGEETIEEMTERLKKLLIGGDDE